MFNLNKYKNILILGFGLEGRASLDYILKKKKNAELSIADQSQKILTEKDKKKYKNFKFILGKNYLKNSFLEKNNYDLIIKSPGVSIDLIPKNRRKFVNTVTNIFLENCRGEIIGVTGTKGKTTTASLIYKILKKAKKDVYLVGNLGNDPLQYLNDTKNKIFVYELSSYQLETLEKSPKVAVFLTMFPDHLDYHSSFLKYKKAKSNIFRFQKSKDLFFYNHNFFKEKDIERVKSKKINFIKKCKIKNNSIYLNNQKIINLADIKLLGEHNLDNIFAAISVANFYKISKSIIKKAIRDFLPIPHRLEFIRKINRIEFYNDAISTTPESTIAGIKVFKKKLGGIILGGLDRGYDFKELAEVLVDIEIDAISFFPNSSNVILRELKKIYKVRGKKLPKYIKTKSMAEAVKFLYKNISPDKVCLLSTASPSYSIFNNFIDKGNQFRKEVEKLKIRK